MDGNSGNDVFDGSTKQPLVGAWHSQKSGPKRTLESAFAGAKKDVQLIELHLSGVVTLPNGPLTAPNGAAILLVPDSGGAMFGGAKLPVTLPILPRVQFP